MVYLPPHPQEKDVNGELNELHFATHFEISSNFLTETVFAPILIRRSKKKPNSMQMTALRFLCWGKTYIEEIILETPVIKWTARRFKPWKDC